MGEVLAIHLYFVYLLLAIKSDINNVGPIWMSTLSIELGESQSRNFFLILSVTVF